MAPALLLVAAYLLGSVPFGLLLARAAGIDVRRAGSGNIGATNVARTAGARLGIATLIADAGKGALPVLAARLAFDDPRLADGAGLAAFLGHVFPITLGFAGGKGVATALGALLALAPTAAAAAVAVFALVLVRSGYVSLASMVAATGAPAALAVLGARATTTGTSAVMVLVILARHRANVRRMQIGTEPRVRKKQAPPRK